MASTRRHLLCGHPHTNDTVLHSPVQLPITGPPIVRYLGGVALPPPCNRYSMSRLSPAPPRAHRALCFPSQIPVLFCSTTPFLCVDMASRKG